MDSIINLILFSIYWILPAYVANGTPLIVGGGTPIDFGKKFFDGKPIFGKGKTIRGFVLGVVAGTIMGFIEGGLLLGFLLSIGALVGDLTGSFLKRRMGIKRGQHAWGMDQLGFVVGAIAFAALLSLPSVSVIITILILTPAIHISTNYCAYKLKLKKVPW